MPNTTLGEAASGAYQAAVEALHSPQAAADDRPALNIRIALARLDDAPAGADQPAHIRRAYREAREYLTKASNDLQTALEHLAVVVAYTDNDW